MSPLLRRRTIQAVLLAGGLLVSGWAASAGADLLPPVPPIPPVQVPTLPLLPPPPAAPHAPPVSVAQAPAPPHVSHPQLPVGATGGSAPTGPQSTRGGLAESSSPSRAPSTPRPTRVYRLRLARDWIARSGPRRGRQTVLTFVLRQPALVEFLVVQVAPECRRMGRFRVQGRSGLNRVRFRGRIGRRLLGPGTYRIRARSLPGRGPALVDTRLVVVAAANREEIAAGRNADTCGRAAGHGTSSYAASSGTTPSATGKTSSSRSAPHPRPVTPAPRHHGVLGARFTKVVEAVKRIPPVLFAILAVAIALLAAASLPLKAVPSSRAAAALAHHRALIALGGAASLAAAMIGYTLR